MKRWHKYEEREKKMGRKEVERREKEAQVRGTGGMKEGRKEGRRE